MPKCNRCGSTTVAWGKTKAGKPMLVEVRPSIPHKAFCPAQKPASSYKETQEMIEQQWGRGRVKELMPYAKGKDLEARMRAVLAHVAKEDA